MSEPHRSPSPDLTSSAPLAGERVTFTGVLASMTHAQAAEIVTTLGGEASEHVSRQVTILVIGEEGWPLEDDGRPSRKLCEVRDWTSRGVMIRVLQESEFLLAAGLAQRSDEIRRLLTPAMLSQLLSVPVHVIRGWERAGLIRAARRVKRLPYFDFQEVTSARRLSELLQAGVSREEIERSLRELPAVQRGDSRPLEQLELLARDRRVIVRDHHGLREVRGQRLLDFAGEADAAARAHQPEHHEHPVTLSFLEARRRALELENRDWFVEGCRHLAEGDMEEAVEAFRLALMAEPHNPEVHFQLGDALYRLGHPRAALERFYSAVELDHDYLEAWMQIGGIHRELGEPESAIDAFSVTLDIHEDCAEVQFLLAETLAELGRATDAVPHWRAYLDCEQRGPWADLARQRLETQGESYQPVTLPL
ncbi:MAG: tetratricopeptide repeat protein [Planctomycetaceae bacterium]